ncbi:MAG: Ferredoxin thioredoxin reductase catalytic beta chain [Methanobacterium sp. PtaU1.Bin242]|nr:MAG: Ferredoxin thioredoxin reductase catalytic beta chain [Methanobacterium sp. PtaU1.Bin242]
MNFKVDDADVDQYYERVKKQAESAGYHLNPDIEFTKSLLKNIIINMKRYGYGACPCRLASGDRKEDMDIICPCDYRDPDLNEYDACYCGLYISGDILNGEKKLKAIPERRPAKEEREKIAGYHTETESSLELPVWRCTVCGYLCAREEPPEICPICKVDKERFKRFM